MAADDVSLMDIFSGWDGYQRSLVTAIAPRSTEQLQFRATADGRSAGEIGAHIAFGRIGWFSNMDAPGSKALAAQAAPFYKPTGATVESITEDAAQIVRWLELSWNMVENVLSTWTVGDLANTYRHEYAGNIYAVSYQWTIWRIMAHDIHHGGQLSLIFAMQNIELPDLGDNGGHIIEPPIIRV